MSEQALYLQQSAAKALFIEVQLAPKPGLVDRFDNGAHQDMHLFTFTESILALQPYFYEYAHAGFTHQGSALELFDKVRHIGQKAEKAMLTATKGINTHKGANFSFALILAAVGKYLQNHTLPLNLADSQIIRQYIQQMTKHLMQTDFQKAKHKANLTNGERLFIEYGITGIRGQAATGYPDLFDHLLPFLRQYLPIKKESQLLRGLLFLMSTIEDSNLIHRGGLSAWKMVQEETTLIHLINDETQFINQLKQYNQSLIARHLSPGGAADLLSLAIFWLILEDKIILPLV